MIKKITFPKYYDGRPCTIYDPESVLNKRIVFLDFDGVIIPYHNDDRNRHNLDKLAIYLYKKYNDEIYLTMNKGNLGMVYYDFDPLALGRLRKLLDDTMSEVVISSDYRWTSDLLQMRALFKIYGMDDYIIDIVDNKLNKAVAIRKYLVEHKEEIENYIILEDDINVNRGFGEHFILTDNLLSDENCEQARKVLGEW